MQNQSKQEKKDRNIKHTSQMRWMRSTDLGHKIWHSPNVLNVQYMLWKKEEENDNDDERRKNHTYLIQNDKKFVVNK